MPVKIPAGVKVEIAGSQVHVRGPKGELTRAFPPSMTISQEGDELIVKRASDERHVRAFHGMTRALIQNMVTGVSLGYSSSCSWRAWAIAPR
jgi:large subunit ribosomal protein L6